LPAAARPDCVVQHETRRKIRQAFAQLPAKYRLVATLALVEDEPYGKIADAVGISAALVKIRVFRAVRMLRKSLTAMGITTGATR
jgi:RNA polymerase sigma factor (sigma-70 family)